MDARDGTPPASTNGAALPVAGHAQPRAAFCGSCGAVARAGRFCECCGAPLGADAPGAVEASNATCLETPSTPANIEVASDARPQDGTEEPARTAVDTGQHPADERGDARRTTRRSRWRRVALVAGYAVLTAALGLVVAHDLGVQGDLERTRDRLGDTEQALGSTKDQLTWAETSLADMTAELDRTRGELAKTQADLESKSSEASSLQTRLDQANRELGGVRGSLADAESRIGLQAGQISTLKTCLSGVTRALSYVTYEDYYSAIASLEAVDVACQSAFELF